MNFSCSDTFEVKSLYKYLLQWTVCLKILLSIMLDAIFVPSKDTTRYLLVSCRTLCSLFEVLVNVVFHVMSVLIMDEDWAFPKEGDGRKYAYIFTRNSYENIHTDCIRKFKQEKYSC
jgi:hypothetical protein